jgi:hypothetical protein
MATMNWLDAHMIDSEVSLATIDETCERFKTRFVLVDDHVLSRSIQEIGLVESPLLVGRAGAYSIVSGFKRVRCLKKMHVQTLRAVVIPEGVCEPEQLFLRALASNHGQTVSEIDCMYVLAKAKNSFSFSTDAICKHIAPLIGLPPSRKVIRGYIRTNMLHDDFKHMMVRGKLAYKAAQILSEYDHATQVFLYTELFKNCLITASDLKNVSEYLHIIQKRDGHALQDILKNEQIHCIMSDMKLDAKSKGERLVQTLKQSAFPCMSLLEERFKRVKSKLQLRPATTLEHAPFFENQSYRLTIEFQTKKSLERSLLSVKQNIDGFDELCSIDKDIPVKS